MLSKYGTIIKTRVNMEPGGTDESEITKAEFAKLKEEILGREKIKKYKTAAVWLAGVILLVYLLYYFS